MACRFYLFLLFLSSNFSISKCPFFQNVYLFHNVIFLSASFTTTLRVSSFRSKPITYCTWLCPVCLETFRFKKGIIKIKN